MKKTISIIGGGSCALMLACELDPSKYSVSVYERNAALGRKFLVAGDGGLNLTHSESADKFIKRYSPSLFLEKAFNHFSNVDLIKWFADIGIAIFVGSSGRVFPVKGIKPAEVLAGILKRIKSNNVALHYKHTWKGFNDDGFLIFENEGKQQSVKSDYFIFCLGGASWPVTGSKGEWLSYFSDKGIPVKPFKASNCAFKIDWPEHLVSKIEGRILKNVSISCVDKSHQGEVVLTRFGIEGSGIYPLSPQISRQLKEGSAEIQIDFKPSFSEVKIFDKINQSSANLSDALKNELNLSQTHIQLIKAFVSKEDFLNKSKLAFYIKNFKLPITGTAPVEEAISTTGGIPLNEINETFELKKMKNCYAVGEMLDYDAPTGGYLLQSCFSMGNFLADYLNNKQD